MNADGSAPIAADLQGGVRSDLLWPLFLGLLLAGIVLLAIGVPLIIAGARAMGQHGPPPYRPTTAGPPAAVPGASGPPSYAGAAGGSSASSPPPPSAVGIFSTPYAARLDGYLDPALSRWMWLVKWFLAIPHLIVLFGPADPRGTPPANSVVAPPASPAGTGPTNQPKGQS